MPETIEGIAAVIDPDENASGPLQAIWLEPIPIAYRKKRALIAFGLGAAITLYFLVMQITNDAPLENYWICIVPIAIGEMRRRYWMQNENVRKYASVTKTFTSGERIKEAVKWMAVGIATGVVFILTLGDHLANNYVMVPFFSVPFLIAGVFF